MSKICPQCHREYEGGRFCNDCGVPLIEKQPSPQQVEGGFNLNFGDANAISGGVNMSDNHSISNNTVNTTTSNVDSHNVITNNITQVERNKTPEEILHENKVKFRKACQDAFANGVLTTTESRKLEELKFQLGLDNDMATRIINDVRVKSSQKSMKLRPIQQKELDKIKSAIRDNSLDTINRLLPTLRVMVQRFIDEDLLYTYYMLQCVLHPDECIKTFERRLEDSYWQTFWTSVAYKRLHRDENALSLQYEVEDKWSDIMPYSNNYILASINKIIENDIESAKNSFEDVEFGEESSLLESLVKSLYGILHEDVLSEVHLQMVEEGAFYYDHLFDTYSTLKNEAESKRLAEEKRQQEEAEAKCLAEEMLQNTYVSSTPFDTKSIALYTNKFGYLNKLSASEISELKQMLLSAPKDNYEAQFALGQLYLQEKQSAANQRLAYNTIKSASEHGVYEAGAYMAYFYLYGKVVKQDLDEAERRIKIDDDYKKNPIFIQMMIDLYAQKGNDMLADVWRTKLSKFK